MEDLVMSYTETIERTPTWIELESVRPLAEAKRITSLSEDSLKKNFPGDIIQLSPRRLGMKLRNILRIAAGET
jgi:hypothetical protein